MSSALERAAAWSFLLLAAALPWSIAPMSIAVALCGALTLAVWWSPRGERWVRTPVDLPAVGWLAALAVAAFLGQDPASGVGRISKGLLLAVVPLAAFHAQEPARARRVVLVLLISAALATVYALVEFVARGGAFPIRVRGAVGHPLTYGGQAMLLAIVAGTIVLVVRDRRWKLGSGALLLLLAAALLGSYTRSAWLGALVGFGTVIALTRGRWLPAVAGAVIALVLVLPPGYRTRALSVFDARSHWNVERILLWDAGWTMFRERPITGVGLQDLRPLVERYRSPEAHEPPHGHMHSIVVQVAVTMGLVGVAALAWLTFALFRTAGRGLRGAVRDPHADRVGLALRLAAVAALAGFFTAGLFEWNLGDEELLDFLYVLVGMAFAASGWEKAWPAARRSS